jgi:predicted enzyme related to lactoylglutathione lyase
MRRTQKFYRDVLGLKRGEEFNKFWSEFATEPTALAFCGSGKSHGWWGVPCIALGVDNIHRAIDALRAKGARILLSPEETSVCWMAWIADPDGNRICIHQRKAGTAG